MAKGNKEKGRRIKIVAVFIVIVATSFLGLVGAFQPAQPPASGQNNSQNNYQEPAVATSTLPAAVPAASSSQKAEQINKNLK